jgi:hypothetical protein
MSTAAYARRRRTTAERGRGRAHVITHQREQIGHGLGVLARQRLEEQLVQDLDVIGEHLREQRRSCIRDRDHRDPLVLASGRARHQAPRIHQMLRIQTDNDHQKRRLP